MVGIFSRFSGGRTAAGTGQHRRTQSSYEERATARPSNTEADLEANTVINGGVGGGVLEFKPVEHPVEPFDNDNPVQCPLTEPSILNDGRMWKERVTVESVRRGRETDLSLMKEEEEEEKEEKEENEEGGRSAVGGDSRLLDHNINRSKPRRPQSNGRMMMQSLSAPERNLINMLQETNNGSGD